MERIRLFSSVRPSGTLRAYKNMHFPSANTIGATTYSYSFAQEPSPLDISLSGDYTHYVFGRGDGNVYVYTSKGLQAIIPMKYFVTPKEK